MTRGVPGTHDANIILDFFKRVKRRKFRSLKLPKFNKAIDDRCKKKLWYKLNLVKVLVLKYSIKSSLILLGLIYVKKKM